ARTGPPQRCAALRWLAIGRLALPQQVPDRLDVAVAGSLAERRDHRLHGTARRVDPADQLDPALRAVADSDAALGFGETEGCLFRQTFGLLAQMFLGGARGQRADGVGGHGSPFPKSTRRPLAGRKVRRTVMFVMGGLGPFRGREAASVGPAEA